MSFDLTRQNLFKTFLYFLLLIVIFWGVELFHPEQYRQFGVPYDASGTPGPAAGTPLGVLIDGFLIRVPALGVLFSSILVFINSFFVTRIIIRNVIFLERTYMPSIIYLLISSGYYNNYLTFRPLLVAFLLLVAIEIIFQSYNYKPLSTGAYMTIGFIFGLSGAIYAPALLLVVLLPVGLTIFRLFDLREWVAAFGGWLIPLFLSAYGVWLAGGEFLSLITSCRDALLAPQPLPSIEYFSSFEWTFIGCVVILFILSLITFFGRSRSYKLKPFKAYMFFIWMLLANLLSLIVLPSRSLYQLPIVAIPLAVIIPTYFNSRKPNFLTNFLYVLMMGCAIVMHLLPFFL
ncbi:hypothetical protein [uncultured Rikenella sp.]|uniref:hypothetical protein n=1 Tax=uncultured Rikenella sp. TaxID=368003 RepID=UPI00262376F1|nr:hypothetical protein [uncultured Rikenella sp.]